MNPVFTYLIHVGDATSQWVNTVFLFGEPNESISGRSWRLRHKIQWHVARVVIDCLMSPFEDDHCFKAYDADMKRAAKTLRGS